MAYDITIKDRIRSYVSTLGLSDRAFEQRAGVSQGFLKASSEPNGKAITSILNAFPELNPDYLILGTGSMLRTPSNLRPVAEVIPAPSSPELAEPKPTKPIQQVNMFSGPSGMSELINFMQQQIATYQEQLNRKDQQLADAAAQINTLLARLDLPK